MGLQNPASEIMLLKIIIKIRCQPVQLFLGCCSCKKYFLNWTCILLTRFHIASEYQLASCYDGTLDNRDSFKTQSTIQNRLLDILSLGRL